MRCAICGGEAPVTRPAEPEVGLRMEIYGCPLHGEFFIEDITGLDHQHFVDADSKRAYSSKHRVEL